MSKYKVGDEVAIAAVVKITAIQPTKTGMVSYATDRGFCIHEVLMDEIALSAKPTDRLMGREEPKPYAKFFTHSADAEKRSAFKIGDHVRHIFYGVGTVIGFEHDYKDWVWFMLDNDDSRPHPSSESNLRKVEPAPQPAPRFKVGDRVKYKSFGKGTVKDVTFLAFVKLYVCSIAFDSGESFSLLEEYISPAPEPKYYSGKVFAVRTKENGAEEDMIARVGHVFEIKDGIAIGDTFWGEDMRFKTFLAFCNFYSATEWREVKE